MNHRVGFGGDLFDDGGAQSTCLAMVQLDYKVNSY